MEDFVFFQIYHDSKSFRYLGLKKNEWISKEQYRQYQFDHMLKYLKLTQAHDGGQING